jgi:hypothetical protein
MYKFVRALFHETMGKHVITINPSIRIEVRQERIGGKFAPLNVTAAPDPRCAWKTNSI